MTGFEPRTFGVESDCFANWATTTANVTNGLDQSPIRVDTTEHNEYLLFLMAFAH